MALHKNSGAHATAAQGEDGARAAHLPSAGLHAVTKQGHYPSARGRNRGGGLLSHAEEHNGEVRVQIGVPVVGQNEICTALRLDAPCHGYGFPSMAKDEDGTVHFGPVPIAGLNANGRHDLHSGARGEKVDYELVPTEAAAKETVSFEKMEAAAISAYHHSSGTVTGGGLPPVAQGKTTVGPAGLGGGDDGGSLAERMRGGFPVVGLALAGVAVTGLVTVATTPVSRFTMFLTLLGGLSLVTMHVLRG